MSIYTNCVLHWPLDEGTGTTANDASGSGNHGTLNTASWHDDATRGWVWDGSANVAATTLNRYVERTGVNPFPGDGTGLTIAGWVYVIAYGTNNYAASKADGNNGTFYYMAGVGATRLGLANSDTTTAYSQHDIASGTAQWWHIAFTYEDGTWRLYRTGVQVGTGTHSVTPSYNLVNSPSQPIRVGGSAAWNAFEGRVSDLAIWSRALSAGEIGDIYNGQWGTAQLKPSVEPLYYGATLLASKSNISWKVISGHNDLNGTVIASGIANATTDAAGLFVLPSNIIGSEGVEAGTQVLLSLYWEEGNPAVDRSITMKTTLVAET